MLSSRRAMCRSSSSEHCLLSTSQHFQDSLHFGDCPCIQALMSVPQGMLCFPTLRLIHHYQPQTCLEFVLALRDFLSSCRDFEKEALQKQREAGPVLDKVRLAEDTVEAAEDQVRRAQEYAKSAEDELRAATEQLR